MGPLTNARIFVGGGGKKKKDDEGTENRRGIDHGCAFSEGRHSRAGVKPALAGLGRRRAGHKWRRV